MLKRIAMISLGAAIVLAPLTALASVTALAQTDQSDAPATNAPPAGSHKSQTRHRNDMSGERAQVGIAPDRRSARAASDQDVVGLPRRRPSICIICDTRANRETAQLSWIDAPRVDATASRYHKAAWVLSCGTPDPALFIIDGP